MKPIAVFLVLLVSASGFAGARLGNAPEMEPVKERKLVLDAMAFGLHADGKTDDGPVIQKMLEQARSVSEPVTIQFPPNKKIYAADGMDRYAFRIDRIHNLSINGGGSTFLLQKDLRFLSASGCSNFVVRNLNVDLAVSPVAEAVVLRQADEQTLLVQLEHPEQAGELGGPTKEDGEQLFFGMLWLAGKYTDSSCHYVVDSVAAASKGHGRVEIRSSEIIPLHIANRIIPGETRVSLPIPGIAHRYGSGSMIRIDRCTNVEWTDVEVWSAPWFAFQIFRNEGTLTFQRVHIRPEPGSGRITSSWRDGFHVKGNKGRLLFEDCILEGMNDDAFNVSTHAWQVTKVLAPNWVRIKQIFPIQFMPFQAGGELLILSVDGTRRLEPVQTASIHGMPGPEIYWPETGTYEARETPELELVLDRPIEGLESGCVLWDKTTANPHTVIRGCRIRNSCRFQSGVTMEECDVSALLYFYCAEVEGPMPSGSVIRNCVLRQGRGNNEYAVVFNGWRGRRSPKTLPDDAAFPLRNLLLENNEIYGGLKIDGAFSVRLRNNRFPDGLGRSRVINSKDVVIEKNRPPLAVE